MTLNAVYRFIAVLGVILSLQGHIEAGNILVWIPTPSLSHQIIARPIIADLCERHHVTYITTNPMKNPKLTNLTEVDVSYSLKLVEKLADFANGNPGIGQSELLKRIWLDLFPAVAEQQLSDAKVLEVLDRKFDLFITETSLYPPLTLLTQHLKCPVVGIASLTPDRLGLERIGDFINPTYDAHFMLGFKRPRNVWEKAYNVLYYVWEWYFQTYDATPKIKEILRRKVGGKIQDYDADMMAEMLLSNTHPILSGVRPSYPNQIHIGGMLKPVMRGLPKDLKDWLDSAKEGVIYFSLGSNIKGTDLPPPVRQALMDGFKQLPLKILWKFEEELPGKPSNVRIQSWLPQVDVLNHENVKIFITQGGLQSLEESIHAKVPIVGFPISSDQFGNVDQLVSLKMAVYLDLATLTSEKLIEAVKEILDEKNSYQENVNKASELLQDSPMPIKDLAVYWIEYVMRHKGAKYLQSTKYKMSWLNYLCFDVILLFGVVLSGVTVMSSMSLCYLYRIVKKLGKKKVSKAGVKKKKH